jgi:hypothetical protein
MSAAGFKPCGAVAIKLAVPVHDRPSINRSRAAELDFQFLGEQRNQAQYQRFFDFAVLGK